MSKKRYGNELHPLYSRWLSMTQRCNNPSCNNYKNYGARGITICSEFNDFTFYAHYLENLPNFSLSNSLDRVDTNKGYQLDNLRWTNCSTQTANQRFSGKGSNKYTGVNWSKVHNRWVARITFKGKTLLSSVHLTEKQAFDTRVAFIKKHKLPHTVHEYYK